jgi:hypothetical protein
MTKSPGLAKALASGTSDPPNRPAPLGLIIDLEKTGQLRPATGRALGCHQRIASQSWRASLNLAQ